MYIVATALYFQITIYTCFADFATGEILVMKGELIQSIIKLHIQLALGVDFGGDAVLEPGICTIFCKFKFSK